MENNIDNFCKFEDFSKTEAENCFRFKNSKNIYKFTPSPEFLAKQQRELQAFQIQQQHELISREAKAEKIRVLGIQLSREEYEGRARKIIDDHKTQEEIQQAEIDLAFAEKQKQESQLNSIDPAISNPDGTPNFK